jgi:hypothetical protein
MSAPPLSCNSVSQRAHLAAQLGDFGLQAFDVVLDGAPLLGLSFTTSFDNRVAYQARIRGHRQQAPRLALSLRLLTRLAQVQESERARREAGGGRGLGQGEVEMTDQKPWRLEKATIDGVEIVDKTEGTGSTPLTASGRTLMRTRSKAL